MSSVKARKRALNNMNDFTPASVDKTYLRRWFSKDLELIAEPLKSMLEDKRSAQEIMLDERTWLFGGVQ